MASLTPITGQLGRQKARHLLYRATFGPTKKEIDDFSVKTANEAMAILFADVEIPNPPVDPKTDSTWLNPKANPDLNSDQEALMEYFMAWYLEQMRKSGTNAKERIAYFYHTHLPTRRTVVKSSEPIYYQNMLYRHYAFGNFKELFKRICIDNAMLIYLDGATNDFGSPNENFAREMFELYSIGKGLQIGDGDYTNYNEDDIKEAARVLSGFTNDPDFTNLDTETNIPIGILTGETTATRHDPGEKVFSAAFQNKTISPSELIDGIATKEAVYGELDELMDMIFDQDETARFIVRKIYRHFVYYDITEEIETDIIVPLANTFKTNNYEIVPVLQQLFKSEHFYDIDNAVTSDNNIGAIIKSPIELILGTLRFFEVTFPDSETEYDEVYDKIYKNGLIPIIIKQGLSFYEPYEVAGYPAYHQVPAFSRNWITPNNLAYRYSFSNQILAGQNDEGETLGIAVDVVAWVDNTENVAEPSDATKVVEALTENLLAVDIDNDRFDFYLNDVFLDTFSASYWTSDWNNYKSTNDDSQVRIKLETLVTALIQSPEFQLF